MVFVGRCVGLGFELDVEMVYFSVADVAESSEVNS